MGLMQIFFKKRQFGTGALPDPRPEFEKAKDYSAEEVLTFGAVPWREKSESEWRKFPIFDQDGSQSCVAQATAKCLGIMNYLEEGQFLMFSARDIYSRRSNYPQAGMYGADACEIARNFGATLNALMDGQRQPETAMNQASDRKPSYEVIGKIYRAKNWFHLPFDIEKIAAIIATGKPVMLLFRFDMNEWNRDVPRIDSASQKPYGHAVTGVDFTLYQNKRAIIIEDSWGEGAGIKGRRIVTEDWFKPSNDRIMGAFYFEDLANLALLNNQLQKPKYIFTRTLGVGSRGNDVAMLQRCLGYLQDDAGYLFPLTTEPTGYYGGVTRAAVKRFQALRNLTQSGIVDTLTLGALNKEFA
jgi:hypothetical protein